MAGASKEDKDRAFSDGARDGAGGAPRDRSPTGGGDRNFFPSEKQREINKAYDQGYTAGKKK